MKRIKEVELIHERLRHIAPMRIDQGRLLNIDDSNVPKWLDSLEGTIIRLNNKAGMVGMKSIIVDIDGRTSELPDAKCESCANLNNSNMYCFELEIYVSAKFACNKHEL